MVKEDEYTLKTDMLTARGERGVRRHSSELASISPKLIEEKLFSFLESATTMSMS